ncbi:MAG: hypothetical protein V1493_03940 [Candidatus Diapherotrites archaeon]
MRRRLPGQMKRGGSKKPKSIGDYFRGQKPKPLRGGASRSERAAYQTLLDKHRQGVKPKAGPGGLAAIRKSLKKALKSGRITIAKPQASRQEFSRNLEKYLNLKGPGREGAADYIKRNPARLIEFFEKESSTSRETAARIAGELRVLEAVPAIERRLDYGHYGKSLEESPKVRAAMMRSLVALGQRSSWKVILDAFKKDSSADVREIASDGIGGILGIASLAELERLRDIELSNFFDQSRVLLNLLDQAVYAKGGRRRY